MPPPAANAVTSSSPFRPAQLDFPERAALPRPTSPNAQAAQAPPDFFLFAYQTMPAAAAVPTPTAVAARTGFAGS